MAKQRAWTAEETRQRRIDFIKARPTLVTRGIIIFVVLALFGLGLMTLLGPSWLAWSCFGAILGGAGVYILQLIDDESGARWTLIGRDTETLTSEALRRIPGASLIPSFQVDRIDIDHVLICPDGVYAVETKFTSKPINTGSRWADRQLRGFIADARNRSQKLQNLLLEEGLGTKVHPMLVVWGYRVSSIRGGALTAGGVLVLVGRQAKQWHTLFGRQLLDQGEAEKVETAVRNRIERFRTHAAHHA